ncbi:MAG: cyclic nucleotide-binding domain-containing protein [Actinomycetota bacterium]
MNLDDLRASSPLLSRLDDPRFDLFESLSTELVLAPDERLFRENDEARRFFIVVRGIIALEIPRPAKPDTTVQTIGSGELLGLSWRLSPHRWMWTARAMVETKLAVFDAAGMRAACETDPELDRLMWEIVAREASERLHHARIQLLDLYGRG